MIDAGQLLIFISAALALNLTPGNDMMYCFGQGLRSGPAAGVAASAGIATGSLIHCLLAAFGMAAAMAAHPVALDVLRWAGIVYLVWLGIQTIRNPTIRPGNVSAPTASFWQAWRGGVIVNLFNPKIAVFVLAFLPQFVDPTQGNPILQFIWLGLILNTGGTLINGLVGGFSGSIGKALTTNEERAKRFNWFSALVFFALAAKLVLDSPSPSTQ